MGWTVPTNRPQRLREVAGAPISVDSPGDPGPHPVRSTEEFIPTARAEVRGNQTKDF